MTLFVAAACGSPQRAPDSAESPQPATPDGLPAAEGALLSAATVDPAGLRCNAHQQWSTTLRAEARLTTQDIFEGLAGLGVAVPADKADAARRLVTDALFWRMVRTSLIEGNFNNLGVHAMKGRTTADGRPLLLFRAGYTPAPLHAESCFRSLVEHGGVRHVANLYSGPMPLADLDAAERKVVAERGGTYFLAREVGDARANWREGLREGEDAHAAARTAMEAVAAIVREVVRPGGNPASGHLMVHCGGGMHRTGMVVAVIERCLNGVDRTQWEAAYRRHVAWRSAADPGGFEAENVAFIEAFDCGLVANL
ncbi:MAG: hypothetical protein EXR79_11880 [Myxococcales bacterium]|nr:hypothetical protein [Myxococcales bacterium]